MLYVGGLSEEATAETVEDAFRPFGDVILPVNMPKDGSAGQKHKGFAFVEMESPEDAAAAIENMHGAELFGRTLKVCCHCRLHKKARCMTM